MSLNTHFLFASLIWGSVGFGYCIYGKRERSLIPFLAGVLMIVVSYFFSALLMSVTCLALIVGVYWLIRRGY